MSFSDPLVSDALAFEAPCPAADAVAPIELLPKWLLCVPLVAQWFALGLRHGSLTLPSVVNPGIETGGLVGESKLACLRLIGDAFQSWVAETVAVPPGADPEMIRSERGLGYPLIAKPDIGWCGFGVRRIESAAELRAYRSLSPNGTLLLQRLIEGGGEAGLFYVRQPGAGQGRLNALALRHRPVILGDGRSTLEELVGRERRTRRALALFRTVLPAGALARVPAAGERVILSTVASTRVGARYEAAPHLITRRLEVILNAIACSMGDFHFGRFDVKFASEADLAAGRFVIIEVNGAGAEAIQYWDPRLSLPEALQGVFAKQSQLFALAAQMRRYGHKPVGVGTLAEAFFFQRALIRDYPPSN